MKRIMLLAGLLLLSQAVFAQWFSDENVREFFYSDGGQFRHMSQAQTGDHETLLKKYDEFDRYYFENANSRLKREGPLKYVELIRNYRRDLYADPRSVTEVRLQEIMYNFEKEREELTMNNLFSYNDNQIISWYLSRPVTHTNMLMKDETYSEYDGLVYENINARLHTAHAKAYLKQARELRREYYISQTHAQYALLRRIYDQDNGYVFADTMSAEERGLVEEYLQMAVPVAGMTDVMALDSFLTEYRKKLPASKRKDYPNKHYK